ncbi:MAG: hypothetical protein LC776_16515, partial [Acidobacteria bacterium]|nr:hypothetical protein [Acidobacteriota bacterium]
CSGRSSAPRRGSDVAIRDVFVEVLYMLSLSRCSVGRPWGARVLVSGPASFTLVQHGGIGLWSALMSMGRATASLAGHPCDLPARGRGDLFVPNADGESRRRPGHAWLCPLACGVMPSRAAR